MHSVCPNGTAWNQDHSHICTFSAKSQTAYRTHIAPQSNFLHQTNRCLPCSTFTCRPNARLLFDIPNSCVKSHAEHDKQNNSHIIQCILVSNANEHIIVICLSATKATTFFICIDMSTRTHTHHKHMLDLDKHPNWPEKQINLASEEKNTKYNIDFWFSSARCEWNVPQSEFSLASSINHF